MQQKRVVIAVSDDVYYTSESDHPVNSAYICYTRYSLHVDIPIAAIWMNMNINLSARTIIREYGIERIKYLVIVIKKICFTYF